jgi:diaminopimelate epimerase
MGNPHAIIFVPFLDAVDFKALGPKFETHPVFPKKTNTEFVQVHIYTYTHTHTNPECVYVYVCVYIHRCPHLSI